MPPSADSGNYHNTVQTQAQAQQGPEPVGHPQDQVPYSQQIFPPVGELHQEIGYNHSHGHDSEPDDDEGESSMLLPPAGTGAFAPGGALSHSEEGGLPPSLLTLADEMDDDMQGMRPLLPSGSGSASASGTTAVGSGVGSGSGLLSDSEASIDRRQIDIIETDRASV